MAVSGRLTGKMGSVWINTAGTGSAGSYVRILDVLEWSYEETLALHNCTIKGESFSRYRPGFNEATVRITRYVTGTSALAPLVEFAIANGNPIQFQLFGVDSPSGSADTVTEAAVTRVEGQGYVTRGRINVPHGLITDEIEITCDGPITLIA